MKVEKDMKIRISRLFEIILDFSFQGHVSNRCNLLYIFDPPKTFYVCTTTQIQILY